MKSRETLIRLKKFQVDEKRRKVMQIEGMIAEFERMANDLEREIKVEQDRAGIHDPTHFAYPTYAKAAIQRRENLKHSADELKAQLNDAKEALAEAFEELKKVELLDERDQMRERAEQAAHEQAELDAIGLMRARNARDLTRPRHRQKNRAPEGARQSMVKPFEKSADGDLVRLGPDHRLAGLEHRRAASRRVLMSGRSGRAAMPTPTTTMPATSDTATILRWVRRSAVFSV